MATKVDAQENHPPVETTTEPTQPTPYTDDETARQRAAFLSKISATDVVREAARSELTAHLRRLEEVSASVSETTTIAAAAADSITNNTTSTNTREEKKEEDSQPVQEEKEAPAPTAAAPSPSPPPEQTPYHHPVHLSSNQTTSLSPSCVTMAQAMACLLPSQKTRQKIPRTRSQKKRRFGLHTRSNC